MKNKHATDILPVLRDYALSVIIRGSQTGLENLTGLSL